MSAARLASHVVTPARAALLAGVADCLPPAPAGGHCVRIGVDGVDGAGMSIFAAQLGALLRSAGQPVVEVSVDDWHRVRARRYGRGRTSPEGFWLDSYDYPRLRAEVLEPLGPGGSGRYRPRGHDLESDEELFGPWRYAPQRAVALVDGIFLQRPELAGCLDFVIFLDVPFEETARRMSERDGTSADPDHPSMARYVAAQRRYLAEWTPWERADLVVDNTDPAAPRLLSAALD